MKNPNNRSFKVYGYLLTAFFSIACYGNSEPSINILTWWGYLSQPWVGKAIEKQCHVKISYDEYYSNPEFSRRWNEQKYNYDMIIFEDIEYPAIQKQIPTIKTKLYRNYKQYNPMIKQKYLQRRYPPNITYFYQAVTGVMWNADKFLIDQNDSFAEMMRKGNNNLVILIDDPLIFQTLQSIGVKNNKLVSLKSFKEIIQNTQILFAINDAKIYPKNNFYLSYTWSGKAISDMLQTNKNFKFLIRPDISYISSDLLAQLDNKPGVACVAEYLTSKAFLTRLQNDTYYFSPYGDASQVQNPTYKNIYMNYLKNLPQLRWIEPLSNEKIADLTQTWKMIRLANSK